MTKISFRQLFHLIFVLFSLFLMGDAFYRWDGFSYYASFSEFLPAVSLAFILWSLVAVLVSIILWLFLKVLFYGGSFLGIRIGPEHSLLFAVLFGALGAVTWKVKKTVWSLMETTLTAKLVVMFSVAVISLMLTRKFCDRFGRLLREILERITPLVWIFGIFVLVSAPLVAYHTWGKDTGNKISKEIVRRTETDRKLPNIIFVTFDALTARDMSLYGYHRETTPFISEWAKTATVFKRCQAESTITTSTIASLLTGKKLWTHQAYQIKSSVQESSSENIALEMRKNGYYTRMYSENSNGTPQVLGVSENFDSVTLALEGSRFLYKFNSMLFVLFHGKIKLYDWLLLEDFYPYVLLQDYYLPIHSRVFGDEKAYFSKGITLLDKFISDVDEHPVPSPFFVWVHLFPPHAPYIPPDEYLGKFDPSQRLRTHLEQREDEKIFREHEEEGFNGNDLDDLKILRARYDEHILFCDREFKDFIDNLERRNLLEDSVIIVSADHGESFEHGHWGHGKSPYEPVVHIPLLIKEPGQRDGRIINDIIEQVDVTSTILALAGATPPSWMEGRSLLPLIRGDGLPQQPALAMFFEETPSGREINNGFINAYDGDYKLIYYIKENRSLFFNLKEDPDEMNDLFDKEPDAGRPLLDFIKDNLEKANERIRSGT